MGANSSIQWTDHTFNPWIGCTKVAPECKNCYAETLMDKRWGKVRWGKGQPRNRTSAANWKQPYAWNREAEATGVRRKVFCASLADVFDEEVEYGWRYDLWNMIQDTVWLDWQLLTKRPQNVKPMIAELAVAICECWDCEGVFPSNVWLGCSAGVDPKPLLDIPAAIHFLSCEPMLKPMNDEQSHLIQKFDWIIFGGESGRNARVCDVDWIRHGIEFCRFYGIAAFVKQLGSNVMGRELDKWVARLRHTHGGDPSEWPQDLRVREFPKTTACPQSELAPSESVFLL